MQGFEKSLSTHLAVFRMPVLLFALTLILFALEGSDVSPEGLLGHPFMRAVTVMVAVMVFGAGIDPRPHMRRRLFTMIAVFFYGMLRGSLLLAESGAYASAVLWASSAAAVAVAIYFVGVSAETE